MIREREMGDRNGQNGTFRDKNMRQPEISISRFCLIFLSYVLLLEESRLFDVYNYIKIVNIDKIFNMNIYAPHNPIILTFLYESETETANIIIHIAASFTGHLCHILISP